MDQNLRFMDRSDRGKLSLTGEQRAWFLDQVLTQSFEDMVPGEAREAAMITVHGRMTAFVEALAAEDSIFVHFEPELRTTFPEALARYVFATRVEIHDVTNEKGLVLVVGAAPQPDELGVPVVVHPTFLGDEPAAHLWVERASLGDLLTALKSAGAEEIGESDFEKLRISAGVPRWGREMHEKTFPQEAGVDERAVHYDKGCYLGQEAMAKIHFRGKVNRRLARLSSSSPIEPGGDLLLDGERVGAVTSAANGNALGLVRYTVAAGTTLMAGDDEVEVTS